MSRKVQRASSYMEPTNATQGIFDVNMYQYYQLVDQKEKTITQINDNLQSKKYEIAHLNVAKETLLIKIEQLEQQIEDLKKQNSKLHHQVSDLRKKNDELTLNSTYNNTIEVQHLRQDNQRLVKLLRENGATLPYGNDPIRYLSFVGELSQIPKEADKLIKESLLWVPSKAYEFAVQFKSKYESDYLSDQQIQLLLFELNKIWSERESTYIKNIKSQCAREKQSVERKSYKPYNEFMLTQQIDRMNKDLKDLQIENIELYANRPQRGVDTLQKQRDRLKQQLSTNIQDKKQKRSTQQHKSQTHVNNDKKSFIDGAIWMGKKLEPQLENNYEKQKLKSEMESVNQMYRNI